MPEELVTVGGKVAVSVLGDTVTVAISHGDEYAAQVVYDAIIEHLRRGEGLTLRLGQKPE